MDRQRAFLFLALLQSGCWLAVNAQKGTKISASRFRSRSIESGDAVYRCFETNCASLHATPNLLTDCFRTHCSSSTTRSTRSADYHLSFIPVGLPWSFHRLRIVLCPASSMTKNEVIRYCTSDACHSIISGQSDKTEYERVELVDGNNCIRICSDLEGGYEDCVKQECCFMGDVPLESLSNSQLISRTRRVNDDVSQCIQSYCSGYSVFRERILCIVKNCNRPVLTS